MSESKVLGKLDFLKPRELRKKLVEVPEWGGSVWVQEMTAGGREQFDEWVVKNNHKAGIRLRILIETAVDEKGALLFSDLDIPDLALKSGKAIERLSDVGMRLSGMSEEAKVEGIKNSEPDPSADSSSASVEN